MAAPVRLALPSAATDRISPTAIYQHQRRQARCQAAELRELSVRRLTATTVRPVTEAKPRSATGRRRSAGGKTVLTCGVRIFLTGIEGGIFATNMPRIQAMSTP